VVTGSDVQRWFSEALGDRPIWRLQDLADMAKAGQAVIWRGDASALFLRLDDYPNGERLIEVGPAGGNLEEILASVPKIEAWARSVGCTQAHVHAGRRGWGSVLKSQGYEVFSTCLRKLL